MHIHATMHMHDSMLTYITSVHVLHAQGDGHYTRIHMQCLYDITYIHNIEQMCVLMYTAHRPAHTHYMYTSMLNGHRFITH